MKNCRESLLFLLVSAFVIANSVPVRAETVVEKKKAASNFDETLLGKRPSQNAEALPLSAQFPAETPSVKPVVASVAAPVAQSPAVKPAAVASQTPSKTAPAAATNEMPQDQVFGASNPSGLVEVSGYKYPVFLYAPKDYKVDRTYAMIVIAPAEDAKAEQQIEYLAGLADRKSVFILAPYVLWPKGGDTPYTLDAWILSVKRDMMERFPISKKRVYLIGKDSGAHYAAYMATKYPKEFAGVALFGQAWAGPFAQLVQPRTDAADQLPFYIALKTGTDAKDKNQGWFDKFQGDGYPLHLVEYKADEELHSLEFKKAAYDWLEAASESWENIVTQKQKTWKGKIKKGIKDFFAV